jgi:hypothetical protein
MINKYELNKARAKKAVLNNANIVFKNGVYKATSPIIYKALKKLIS